MLARAETEGPTQNVGRTPSPPVASAKLTMLGRHYTRELALARDRQESYKD